MYEKLSQTLVLKKVFFCIKKIYCQSNLGKVFLQRAEDTSSTNSSVDVFYYSFIIHIYPSSKLKYSPALPDIRTFEIAHTGIFTGSDH